MDLSKKITDLTEAFDENKLNQKIKNHFEIAALLENLKSKEDFEKFAALAFTAKYVNGLKKILSGRSVTSDKYMERIFEEFNINVQKFFEQLKSIAQILPPENAGLFDRKYLVQNHESMLNAMDLIDDLTVCKEFMNS